MAHLDDSTKRGLRVLAQAGGSVSHHRCVNSPMLRKVARIAFGQKPATPPLNELGEPWLSCYDDFGVAVVVSAPADVELHRLLQLFCCERVDTQELSDRRLQVIPTPCRKLLLLEESARCAFGLHSDAEGLVLTQAAAGEAGERTVVLLGQLDTQRILPTIGVSVAVDAEKKHIMGDVAFHVLWEELAVHMGDDMKLQQLVRTSTAHAFVAFVRKSKVAKTAVCMAATF
mmetsp:Transcript_44562/g.96600  ORF Transcript_44562/g.96600 Transcript_44562/m.96600 type:complete len:229 (-) Transcript_44562:20-706(-)